jgi:hypothetical protein
VGCPGPGGTLGGSARRFATSVLSTAV